jgi:hypothetical protein
MSNWNSNLYIGDRVNVIIPQTTRDPRTHKIIVKHFSGYGEVESIDLNGESLTVHFDDGHVQKVRNTQVQKLEAVAA